MLIRHNQIFCPVFIGWPMKTANHSVFWLDLFSITFFQRPIGWLEIIQNWTSLFFGESRGFYFLEGEKCLGSRKKGHKICILVRIWWSVKTGSDHKSNRKWQAWPQCRTKNIRSKNLPRTKRVADIWQMCVYDNDVIMT